MFAINLLVNAYKRNKLHQEKREALMPNYADWSEQTHS